MSSTSPRQETYPAFGSPIPYAEPLWYSRNVSPHYHDSHRKLRAAVRKYVDEEIRPNAFEWESQGQVPESARDPLGSSSCDLTSFRPGNDMLSWDTLAW